MQLGISSAKKKKKLNHHHGQIDKLNAQSWGPYQHLINSYATKPT